MTGHRLNCPSSLTKPDCITAWHKGVKRGQRKTKKVFNSPLLR